MSFATFKPQILPNIANWRPSKKAGETDYTVIVIEFRNLIGIYHVSTETKAIELANNLLEKHLKKHGRTLEEPNADFLQLATTENPIARADVSGGE